MFETYKFDLFLCISMKFGEPKKSWKYTIKLLYLRLIEILEMQMIIFYYYVKDLHEIADILGVLYQDDCKAEQLRFYPHEIQNNIDIEDIL